MFTAKEPKNDKQKAPDDRRNYKWLRLREEGYEHCGGFPRSDRKSAALLFGGHKVTH